MSKSSKTQGGARAGRAKLDELRQAQQAKERRSRIILITAVATVILLIAGIVGFTVWRDVSTRPSLDAVQTFEVARDHTTEPVTYPQSPPVGGPHNPSWLNCGVYTEPVPNENAVHSMEHGAIWVTYDPSLSDDELSTLRAKLPSSYVILSPFEGLPSPIVLSGWNSQLQVDDADDERIAQYLEEYWLSQDVPEPGALCTGGLDAPGKA